MKSFLIAMMIGLFSSPGITDAMAETAERNPILSQERLEIVSQQAVHAFTVELAQTPEQQRLGLMNRTTLAPDAGMLFVFPFPRPTAFWMHNTLIALDMLFIDPQGRIIRIEERAEPQTDTPRRSGGDVIAVLEIAGGRATALGIRAGDRVQHRFFRAPIE